MRSFPPKYPQKPHTLRGFCWVFVVAVTLWPLLPPSSPSSDVDGLRCLHYIQSLRREARQALNEHVRLLHREDTTRFAKLLIALSMLRSIRPAVVAQLFLKPVIGTVNIEEVLMEMFYGK